MFSKHEYRPTGPTPPQQPSEILAVPAEAEDIGEIPEISNLSDPHERVEQFLEDHAAAFEAVQQSWQEVRTHQKATSAELPSPAEISGVEAILSQQAAARGQRGIPRGARQFRRLFTGLSATLSRQEIAVTRFEAHKTYIAWTRETTDRSDDAIVSLSSQFEGSEPSVPTFVPNAVISNEHSSTNTSLGRAYITAYALQDRALAILEKGFGDDTLCAPLLERILGLAKEGKAGVREFPGLLETLAVHQAREKKTSIVTQAIERLSDEALRVSFVEQMLDSSGQTKVRIGKELAALVAGIQMMGEICARETGRPLENVGNLLLRYPQLWPSELEGSYASYKLQHTKSQQTEAYNLLAPYLESGRLPAPYAERRPLDRLLSSQKLTPHTAAQATQGRQRSPNAKFASPDADDLGAEEEPRITEFALLKRQSGGNLHSLVFLSGGIDELMQTAQITDYIERYKTEPDLENTLRACFEHLTRKPFDKLATKRLVDGRYTFMKGESEYGHQRNMRQCSLRRLPSVSTGIVSAVTRIFYDVITLDSQPVLVLHSIHHKNEIDKSSKIF